MDKDKIRNNARELKYKKDTLMDIVAIGVSVYKKYFFCLRTNTNKEW